MVKYNIEVSSETTNLMQAIEAQHQVKLECEEIVATEPLLMFCPATGAVKQHIKEKIWVTVTLNDPNRHVVH